MDMQLEYFLYFITGIADKVFETISDMSEEERTEKLHPDTKFAFDAILALAED